MDLSAYVEKSATRRCSLYPKILEYADKNRKEGWFVDVTVEVDDLKIPANQLVLSCCSKVFEKMFKSQMKERYDKTVNISAVDGESVETLIDFMYSGKIIIDSKNALRLLAAADYLQMGEVKMYCAEFLHDILIPSTYFTVLCAANLYRLESLQNQIYDLISSNFDEIVQAEDSWSMSETDIQSCISKLDRAQVKETSVYQAIVKWTKLDEDARAKHFPKLFQLVQLDKLPRKFLQETVSSEDLVSENLSCQKSVMSCLFAVLDGKSERVSKTEVTTKILSIGGQNTPDKVIEFHKYGGKAKATKHFHAAESFGKGWTIKHGEKIYHLGGNLTFVNDNWQSVDRVIPVKLEEITNSTEALAPMKHGRRLYGAAVFCDTLVVTGGLGNPKGTYLCTAEYYRAATDEWRFIEPTIIAKCSNVLVVCEDCLYDIGGTNGRQSLSAVEQLSGLKSNWKMVEPMQQRREGHAAVACGGRIYAIGGGNGPNIDLRTKSVECYEPKSNKWMYVQDMKHARAGHAACVFKDKIYVIGGKDDQHRYVREIECYDPANNAWSVVGITPVDLYRHSLLVL